MGISFRREGCNRPFRNPMNGFAPETYAIEVRWDPLLGHTAVYNPVLEDKARLFFGDHDWGLVRQMAETSRQGCFMCPEKVHEVTPMYPDGLIPGGRLTDGDCTLFPNLFPLTMYHAVVAVGGEHYRELNQFTPDLLEQGLRVSLAFVRRVLAKDPDVAWGAVCANYLPPAGASLVHPHFQVVLGVEPLALAQREEEESRRFFEREGRSFWDLLCEAEVADGERYVATLDRTVFLSSFAPLGGNEVLGIVRGATDLEALTSSDLACLAKGLSAVLAGYQDMGCGTFNLILYLPPLRRRAPWLPAHLRLISRQNFYPNYRTDDFFLQRLLSSELMISPPEKLASRLKAFFP